MLRLSCNDAGFSCDVVFVADTEDELNRQLLKHGMEFHGLDKDDITPELQRKIKTLIRRS